MSANETTVFVYHYLADYRAPVFKKLVTAIGCDIIADTTANNDIALIENPERLFGRHFRKVKNKWITSSVLWQRHLTSKLWSSSYKNVVFLGDPNFVSTWLNLLLGRIAGRRVYLWTHGFVDRGSLVSRAVKLLMYSLSSGIMVYGENEHANLQKFWFLRKKVTTIYNSLDYVSHREIRENLGSDVLTRLKHEMFRDRSDLPVLLFIGRLTFHKKLRQLLELSVYLRSQGHDCNLLFVGEGEARVELEEFTREQAIPSVVFAGRCYDELLTAKYIALSNVCVAPGEVGLTAMHTLSFGTPIVTHSDHKMQMPEWEAVVEGETGALFDRGDISSLAAATIRVLKLDREATRKACIEMIEAKYTPAVQCQRICEFLKVGT